jgi:hypothetical protein
MTVAEIFRRSMILYQENFLKLIGIVSPPLIIGSIISQFIFGNNMDEAMGSTTEPGAMGAMFLYAVIMIFLSSIVTATGTTAISERFLDREISISESYLRVADNLFPLLGAVIIASIITAVGLMLCLLPGVVTAVWFCLIPPIVMIEGEGGIGALRRSRTLVKGYFWKTFLVVVLLASIQFSVVAIAFSLPTLIKNVPGLYFVAAFVAILLPLLIEPLKIATTTMLYYDLRIRKEGYNLEVMAEELTNSTAQLKIEE